MREEEIIAAIDNKVTTYSPWTIGITDDPERRRKEHGNPSAWKAWKADSESIARSVEDHFQKKGMKGSTGGGDKPNYVYIF